MTSFTIEFNDKLVNRIFNELKGEFMVGRLFDFGFTQVDYKSTCSLSETSSETFLTRSLITFTDTQYRRWQFKMTADGNYTLFRVYKYVYGERLELWSLDPDTLVSSDKFEFLTLNGSGL